MATRTPFGLWLVAIVALSTARSGSYGREIGSEVRYAPPLQNSIFAVLMTASFVWMACALWSTSERWAMLALCSLLGIVFPLVFQPYALQVDLERRTYRLTQGWPPLQKRWNGRLDDVARLKTVYAKGDTFLTVAWKEPGPRSVRLGSFKTRRAAEAAAVQIQKTWEISVPIMSRE